MPGGIERAIVNTANLFVTKGHTVTLLILDGTGDSFYQIHPAVNIIQQPLSFGITKEGNIVTRKIKFLSDVLAVRTLLKRLKADLVIATEYPFAAGAILSGARKYSKIISWEHHHFYELKRNTFWNKVFNFTYPRLHVIVSLNDDEKKLFEVLNPAVVTIPNLTNPLTSRANLTNKIILTVARLVHVKGIDLLISAAKIVLREHPDWTWKVIGNSPDDHILKDIIKKDGLANSLILQEPVDQHIIPEYLGASLYVMTSRHECLPMTLIEAQSAGLPCIAFDCDTGPRHIIKHKDNGLLIEKENSAKLAKAISSLIINEEQRKKMGDKAFEDSTNFSPETVYELWSKLFY